MQIYEQRPVRQPEDCGYVWMFYWQATCPFLPLDLVRAALVTSSILKKHGMMLKCGTPINSPSNTSLRRINQIELLLTHHKGWLQNESNF